MKARMTFLSDNILKMMDEKDRKAMGKAGMLASEGAERCACEKESELQYQMKAILNLRGIASYHSRFNVKSTLDEDGLPDFAFVNNGRPIAVEAKRPGGVASTEQLRQHARMRANGWRVEVIDNLDDFRKLLEENYE